MSSQVEKRIEQLRERANHLLEEMDRTVPLSGVNVYDEKERQDMFDEWSDLNREIIRLKKSGK